MFKMRIQFKEGHAETFLDVEFYEVSGSLFWIHGSSEALSPKSFGWPVDDIQSIRAEYIRPKNEIEESIE